MFADAQGRGVDFSGASLEDADFEGAWLTDVDGRGVESAARPRTDTLPKGWRPRGVPMAAGEKAALCKDVVVAAP